MWIVSQGRTASLLERLLISNPIQSLGVRMDGVWRRQPASPTVRLERQEISPTPIQGFSRALVPLNPPELVNGSFSAKQLTESRDENEPKMICCSVAPAQ